MKSFLARTARPIEIGLGLFFVIGALLKSGLVFDDSNMDLFIRQIIGYGLLEARHLLESAALLTLTIEMLLGLALLLALRQGMLSFTVMHALLIAFTGLILYGWIVHDLEDCGCLGKIKMTPQMSIAKNIALMALGILAWLGFKHQGETATKTPSAFAQRIIITLILTITTVAYAYNDLNVISERIAKNQEEGPFTKFVFDLEEGSFNLGQGEHLVAILNMECDHCMESVPGINALAADPNLPPLVALCYEPNPDSMLVFRTMTDPQFPMYPMGDNYDPFIDLLENAPPQISYVKDGQQLHHWTEHAPTSDQVLKVIAAPAGTE
jgi:hypothetical protein